MVQRTRRCGLPRVMKWTYHGPKMGQVVTNTLRSTPLGSKLPSDALRIGSKWPKYKEIWRGYS